MRDQDHCHAHPALQVGQQAQDLRLHRHVETARGLVRDQQRRASHERHGDHHALPHAAGKLVRVLGGPQLGRRHPDIAEHGYGAGPRRVVRSVLMDANRFGDLLADRQDRVECGRRVLEHHGNAIAPDGAQVALIERREIAPVEHDAARLDATRRLDEPEDRQGRGGFTAPGFAYHTQRLADLDVPRHAIDRPRHTPGSLENGVKVLD